MANFLELFEDEKNTQLFNFNFQLLELPEKAEFSYYDNFDIISVDKEKIDLKLTRKTFFIPDSVFCSSVSFVVTLFFKPEYQDSAEFKKFNIIKEIAGNVDEIFAPALTRASALLAQTSVYFGGDDPIVLPPLFENKATK